MKYKLFLFLYLFLVFIAGQANGSNCQFDNQIIGAKYTISEGAVNQTGNGELREGKLSQRNLTFWRKNNEVAFEHSDQKITEVFNLVSNGLVRPVRYFDEYKHGIEYQPGEIRNGKENTDWLTKYQIIPQSLIQKLKKVSSEGEGCELVESMILEGDNIRVQLDWMPNYLLPKTFTLTTNGRKTMWEVSELVKSQAEIKAFFKSKHRYRTTDYADIGDNESDPFLLKMINLGFVSHGASGIYNVQGEAMQIEKSHQGHQH